VKVGLCNIIKVIGRTVPRDNFFKVFVYIYFAATCFGPRRPSSDGIHNYFREVKKVVARDCSSNNLDKVHATGCKNYATLPCGSSVINFRTPEPVVVKLGMCVMAGVPVSVVFFINPSY
jgi:hypothetical protein